MSNLKFMQRAYELALKGKGKTFPNPMVGAVVVKAGRIVAEGWHRRCGGPHAEIEAFRRAGSKTEGAQLYVTLEPCSHFGRTPPCVDDVMARGISEVIIGMKDPNPLTCGKSIAKLKKAGAKIKILKTVGVEGELKRKIEEMNAPFIKFITKQMPWVVAKTAQTLDGKIATAAKQSKWITSEQTRAFARRRRDDFDAIMVGINTVLRDDPSLSAANPSKRLKKIVLDSSLKIDSNARIFQKARPQDCIIATTNRADKGRWKQLEQKGVVVIECPLSGQQFDLAWLLKELARRGIGKILIEGGAHVVGSALREKLVDEMHIYMAPKIFGEQEALSSVRGCHVADINQAIQLKDIRVQSMGSDFLIEGKIKYN
ncbi:MAG: bifunctional diaminohydroxyphosphoribosylaminopyrimidine deaminase/5-amino-6-(5-phosphoribosylamino)uracil reductase RibD [Candidatus Omnitrophica bacterium]|nr:bifunctional diaminohydroxyphosphoribosylaminopyrimidine deaminase/5-amino-6-(5-phosphoribosylamino)uracil reductase RibD [Candidatus Omnitrophota bacterium]